jgi:transposase
MEDLLLATLQYLREKRYWVEETFQKHSLNAEKKAYNHWLSKQRISVENIFATLKVFKIIGTRHYNHLKLLHLRFYLLAGMYNYELQL